LVIVIIVKAGCAACKTLIKARTAERAVFSRHGAAVTDCMQAMAELGRRPSYLEAAAGEIMRDALKHQVLNIAAPDLCSCKGAMTRTRCCEHSAGDVIGTATAIPRHDVF
jgi:hypothetical protein